MAIVKNIRQNRYIRSGRLFRSYYPHVCDRCGATFNAAALRRGHSRSECDEMMIFNDQHPRLWSAAIEIKTLQALERACRSVK